MHEILTSIDIDASPERVWSVLAALREYDEWNPFMTRVKGTLSAGAPFSFIASVAGREVPIRARMIRAEPMQELRWRGPRSSALGKIFSGEHYVKLDAVGEGKTRVTHGEHFSGALVQLFWRRIRAAIEPAYTAMNEALKRRAEAGS